MGDRPTLFLSSRSLTAFTAGHVFVLNGPAPTSSDHLRAHLLLPRPLHLRVFYQEADARLWVDDGFPHGEVDLDTPGNFSPPTPNQDGVLHALVPGGKMFVDLFDVDSTTAFFRALGSSNCADGVRVVGVPRHVLTRGMPGPRSGVKRRRLSLATKTAARPTPVPVRAASKTTTRGGGALHASMTRGRSVVMLAAEQTPASVPAWTRAVGGSSSPLQVRRRHARSSGTGSNKTPAARRRVAWLYGGAGGSRENDEELRVAFLPTLRLPTSLGGAVLKVCRLLAIRTSVFLIGPPGCGKTYLVTEAVKALRAAGAAVSVCGSSGVAAALVGGTTVHSWAGYVNGEADVVTPLETVLKEVIPFAAKKRICSSMVLVIDEVGTLSAAFITRLDLVLRGVRRQPETPFGGMVLLFSGDCLQLAPPFGNFAFLCDAWRDLFGHRAVVLDTHWRHIKDRRLLDVLLRTRVGNHTEQDMELLATRRSEHPPPSAVWLFCHTLKANEKNDDELRRLPRREVTYNAQDEVKVKYVTVDEASNLLDGLRLPRVLSLRVGAFVFVPSNCLSRHGVPCGSRGVVICFFWVGGMQYPTVRFELPTGGFLTLDVVPVTGRVVALGGVDTAATRTQVPLVLWWAMTVHGAQGWTVLEAAVDLSRAWAAGQALSGLSRTPTLSGLHLVGFDEDKVVVDSFAVSFYELLVPY
ncbi:hypothetical protein BU14_0086s0001 [Porphyra umbilicalis]|uniref:ATP-dependent DNA helicase n=1 Tax=Porphyra umbilicalis TaxID=2786 RepID=A0A1X6PE50_PORUM|nr:hypothetical protein BU14_0086s0001 [Porphyra umbilicalis]|eukprot:OSX79114.1 hypothetical protein BU14_0086s0001 [Porphyra umbilicalis]